MVQLLWHSLYWILLSACQKALEHNGEELALAKDTNSDNLIGICYNNLAADYLKMDNIAKAKQLYAAALETSRRLKNKGTERVALFNLARFNYKIAPEFLTLYLSN